MLHHITSYHVISRHVTLCHMLCHVIFVMRCHAIIYHVRSHHLTSYYIILSCPIISHDYVGGTRGVLQCRHLTLQTSTLLPGAHISLMARMRMMISETDRPPPSGVH